MPAVESDDIIAMLQHHHPDPSPNQPWEIEISDDFNAHRTDAISRLCGDLILMGVIMPSKVTLLRKD